jgi:hypothetical protein
MPRWRRRRLARQRRMDERAMRFVILGLQRPGFYHAATELAAKYYRSVERMHRAIFGVGARVRD